MALFDIKAIREKTGDEFAEMTDEDMARKLHSSYGFKTKFEDVAKNYYGFDPSDNAKRRFGQAVDELQGSAYGALGLAGDALGIKSVKEYGLKNADRNFKQSKQQSRKNDDITNFSEDDFSVGDYVAGGLGYLGGNALSAIAGGGVGGFIGKKVAAKGVQKAIKANAEELAKKGIQKDLLKDAKDKIADGLTDQAKKRGGNVGATVGALTTSYGQSAGSLYADLEGKGDENAVAKSLGYSVPIAALDTVADISLFKALTGAGKPSKLVAKEGDGLLKNTARVTGRMGIGATRQGSIESGTELAQGSIERFAKGEEVLNKNAMINEAALGFLGGGTIGSVGAYINRGDPVELAPAEREKQIVNEATTEALAQSQARNSELNKQFEQDLTSPESLSFVPPELESAAPITKVNTAPTTGSVVAPQQEVKADDAVIDYPTIAQAFGGSVTLTPSGNTLRAEFGKPGARRVFGSDEAKKELTRLAKMQESYGPAASAYVNALIDNEYKFKSFKDIESQLKNFGITPDMEPAVIAEQIDARLSDLSGIRGIEARNKYENALTQFKNTILGGQAAPVVTDTTVTPSPAPTVTPTAAPTSAPTIAPTAAPAALDIEDENEILLAIMQKFNRGNNRKYNREQATQAIDLLFAANDATKQEELAARMGISLGALKTRLTGVREKFGMSKDAATNIESTARLNKIADELGIPQETLKRSLARFQSAGDFGSKSDSISASGSEQETAQKVDVNAIDTRVRQMIEEENESTRQYNAKMGANEPIYTEGTPEYAEIYAEFRDNVLGEDTDVAREAKEAIKKQEILNETTQTVSDLGDVNGTTEGADGNDKPVVNMRTNANATGYSSFAEKVAAEGKDSRFGKIASAIKRRDVAEDKLVSAMEKPNYSRAEVKVLEDVLAQRDKELTASIKSVLKDLKADERTEIENTIAQEEADLKEAGSRVNLAVRRAGIRKEDTATAKAQAVDPDEDAISKFLAVSNEEVDLGGMKVRFTEALTNAGISPAKLRTDATVMDQIRQAAKDGTFKQVSTDPRFLVYQKIINDAITNAANGRGGNARRSIKDSEVEALLFGMLDSRVKAATERAKRNFRKAVNMLFDQYSEMGIDGAVLDKITDMRVDNLIGINADGAFYPDTGELVMDILFTANAPIETVVAVMHHEVGHVIDIDAEDGSYRYSDDPRIQSTIRKGKLSPIRSSSNPDIGAVIDEVENAALWESTFAELIKYPMDAAAYKLDLQTAKAELFAQLWRAYNTDVKGVFDIMPVAKQWMEQVEAELNETNNNSSRDDQGAQDNPGSVADSQGTGRVFQSPTGVGTKTPQSTGGSRTSTGGSGRSNGTVQKVISNLPEPLRGMASAVGSVAKYNFGRVVNYIANTKDLAALAQKYLPSASSVVELLDKKAADISKYEDEYRKIFQAYTAIDDKVKKKLNAVIRKATTDQDNEYQTKPDFLALPKDAQKIVKDVFARGKKDAETKRDELTKMVKDLIATTDNETTKRALQIDLQEIADTYAVYLSGPYAPLARFGEYIVVAKSPEFIAAQASKKSMGEMRKDPKHYSVSFHESMYDAQRKSDELSQAGMQAEPFRKDDIRADLFSGPTVMETINKLKASLPAIEDGDTKGAAANKKLSSMLEQLYATTLAETHARKYREGIAGFDEDMMRGFFKYGQAEARFVASLRFDAKINETFRNLKDEADRGQVGDRKTRREYYLELLSRHADVGNSSPKLISNLMRASSIFYLSLSPGYYLTNATQVAMMTVPFLAGRFGAGKAWGETLKAYKETSDLMKGKWIKGDPDVSKLSKDVQPLVKRMLDEGWLDVSSVQDLGNIDIDSANTAVKGLKKADNFFRDAQYKVELLNRVTSAIAAYRLTGGGEKGIKFARETLDRTQGDYSDANAPRWMKTSFGRLAFQFRKYQIMQAGTLVRLFKDWTDTGVSKTEREIARRQLTFMLAHAAVIGGAKNLPMVGALLGIYALATDAPEDEEEIIRSLSDDPDIGTLLTRGLPALLGLDLSSRVGFQNTLSMFPYFDGDLSKERDSWDKLATAVLGPAFAMSRDVVMGASLLADGNLYGAATTALPSGLRNAIAGGMYQVDGMTTKKGDLQLSKDELTLWDSFMKGLGLETTKTSMNKYVSRRAYETDRFYRDKEESIKTKYVKAKRDNDSGTMLELRSEWREIQMDKKERGVKVTPLSQLLKAPANAEKRENSRVGGVRAPESTKEYVKRLGGE